jgi:fluoride ion exporter CrcB/FEX
MDPYVILLLTGAAGGLTRAFTGWLNQSDIGESFSIRKSIASVIRATIAGAFFAYTTANIEPGTSLTTATIANVFFQSIGGEVLMKEVYGTLKK